MKYLDRIPQHKYPWLPTLYSMVLDIKPKTIVEYGTEHGGTATVMGLALQQLFEEEGHRGKVYTYDTFEKQSKGEIGSSPNYSLAIQNIRRFGLESFVEVDYGDFYEFCDRPDKNFDLLYFDIDNDGDKLLEMYNGCKTNINNGSIIIFEGGSNVRDNVEWMITKNKTKMNDVKELLDYTLLTPDQKYSCSIIYNKKIYSL
jgi:predicted O-methyltransferase YrrM